jgi:hypothetical protein
MRMWLELITRAICELIVLCEYPLEFHHRMEVYVSIEQVYTQWNHQSDTVFAGDPRCFDLAILQCSKGKIIITIQSKYCQRWCANANTVQVNIRIPVMS